MTHDPEQPSRRSVPRGCPCVDEVDIDARNEPKDDEPEVDARNEAESDEPEDDRSEIGGAETDEDDCPEHRTAWLRLLRAVLLAIVAVARLIRAL